MAFNPFNVFRRNQKFLFACLTIMVMFMFVLSSGMGRSDFFQWFPEWLGSKRATGETVAVIDGRKLTTSQIGTTLDQRRKANRFMAEMSARAAQNINNYLSESSSKADREGGQNAIQQLVTLRQQGYVNQQQLMMAQFQGQQITQEFVAAVRNQTLGGLIQSLSAVVNNPASKSEDKELCKLGQTLIRLDATMMVNGGNYFANIPNRDTKDVLEFELWKKKADKLGINLTSEDCEKLVYSELFNRVSAEDWQAAYRRVSEGEQRANPAKLMQALVEEFRVRIAMASVRGPVTSFGEDEFQINQTIAPPYSEYRFYQEQTSESDYLILGIPVQNFMEKVTGQPTEQELREIFTKYRMNEPNPALERPGLKEPRKLKLEWLEAKGNEPFYVAAAKDALPKCELFAKLTGFLTAPLGPSGGLEQLTAPGFLNLKPDDTTASVYESYKTTSKFGIERVWNFAYVPSQADVTDAALVRAPNLASLAGAMAGSLMTYGPISAPAVTFLERARTDERNAKARAYGAFFTVPVFGSMSPLGASLAAYAKLPEPLPPAVLRIDSEQKVRDRLARQICFNDMQQFGKEMSAKGKSIDKSSARDYFEKFVKERKLTTGASAEFKDQYTMSDDPGLKSIKERHVKTHGKLANIAPMGRQFFFDRETDFMGRPSGPEKPASTYYVPTVYPYNLAPNDPNASWLGSSFVGTQTGGADTEPMLLIWRTAELPAEEPKSLDDKTRAKAIAAWKRMKARELAKAKADEIAAEAKTFGAAADVIRARLIDHQAKLKAEQKDQAAMERVRYFELDKVAPIVTVRGFQPGRDQISEFSLQRTEDMPYPTPQMVKDLLDHRDKDIPTAVVMVDNPKDMYYVAVLGAKNDRRPFEYALGVYMPFGPMQGPMGQRVRNDFQYDSFRKTRELTLNLLKAEFNVTGENEKLLAEKSDAIE